MSKSKKKVGFLSSLVISWPVIIGSLIASLVLNWTGLTSVAIFLFALFIVGLLSRLWGFSVLKNIEVGITSDKETLTVGDGVLISYTIANNKLLPVIWLELCQDMPANNCLAPDDGFSLYRFSALEAELEGSSAIYRRRIIFLIGFQKLAWETRWTAKRRGIYYLDHFILRSGDGFGFTQSSQTLPAGDNIFVVWPKIIPVAAERFFRNVWQGNTGRQGHVEDITVLRSLRDYVPGDQWKRIDWRVAARQDELQVKLFETVLPATVHFIFDIMSFTGLSEENDELEDAISVLASLILELDRFGVRCGLSLPKTGAAPAVNIDPDDLSVTRNDLLFYLSGLDAAGASNIFDEAGIDNLSHKAGQLWLVTYSGKRLGCTRLADRFEDKGLSILCTDSAEPGILSKCPSLTLGDIKRGAK
jgi:uncharacterized protein (DUF58 family)